MSTSVFEPQYHMGMRWKAVAKSRCDELSSVYFASSHHGMGSSQVRIVNALLWSVSPHSLQLWTRSRR
jgi:hypothetical protein